MSVLKLSTYRRFYTGIYPYTVLTSVFTTASALDPVTLKITGSVQEWCGHTFSQLNWRGDHYDGELRSYF